MELKRSAREKYRLKITTLPAVAGTWEASFDGEATWDVGTPATFNGTPVTEWLVAGPDVALGTAVAVITEDMVPAIRVTESPEIVVRDAPSIVLVP